MHAKANPDDRELLAGGRSVKVPCGRSLRIEVSILMEELDAFFDTEGGDEATHGFSDRQASLAAGAVEPSGVFEYSQPPHPQDGIPQEEAAGAAGFPALPL
jgi:hypothetical protein